jgi:hypothetical protein
VSSRLPGGKTCPDTDADPGAIEPRVGLAGGLRRPASRGGTVVAISGPPGVVRSPPESVRSSGGTPNGPRRGLNDPGGHRDRNDGPGQRWLTYRMKNGGACKSCGGFRPERKRAITRVGYSNSASGPEIGPPGRILAGLIPGMHRNRPSGRPKGRFRGQARKMGQDAPKINPVDQFKAMWLIPGPSQQLQCRLLK